MSNYTGPPPPYAYANIYVCANVNTDPDAMEFVCIPVSPTFRYSLDYAIVLVHSAIL